MGNIVSCCSKKQCSERKVLIRNDPICQRARSSSDLSNYVYDDEDFEECDMKKVSLYFNDFVIWHHTKKNDRFC